MSYHNLWSKETFPGPKIAYTLLTIVAAKSSTDTGSFYTRDRETETQTQRDRDREIRTEIEIEGER